MHDQRHRRLGSPRRSPNRSYYVNDVAFIFKTTQSLQLRDSEAGQRRTGASPEHGYPQHLDAGKRSRLGNDNSMAWLLPPPRCQSPANRVW